MKKVFIGILIIICFLVAGCSNHKTDDQKLKDTFNRIGEYFGNESTDRSNLGAYYIDEEKGKVVVVLVDNSVEQQDKFKKIANVDLKYVLFVQGGPYTTFSN